VLFFSCFDDALWRLDRKEVGGGRRGVEANLVAATAGDEVDSHLTRTQDDAAVLYAGLLFCYFLCFPPMRMFEG
jgi:hypothetical protein